MGRCRRDLDLVDFQPVAVAAWSETFVDLTQQVSNDCCGGEQRIKFGLQRRRDRTRSHLVLDDAAEGLDLGPHCGLVCPSFGLSQHPSQGAFGVCDLMYFGEPPFAYLLHGVVLR